MLGHGAGQRVKQETSGPEIIRCGPDEPARDELQRGGGCGPAVDIQPHAQRRVQRSSGQADLDPARAQVAVVLNRNEQPASPNQSSPPCLVRSQLSSAATYVSKGTSAIRQNDSDPRSGTMLALMSSAPPAAAGCLVPPRTPGTLSGSCISRFAVRPLPPHRTKALSSVCSDGLGASYPAAAGLSRPSPGQDGRRHHGHSLDGILPVSCVRTRPASTQGTSGTTTT